MRGLIGIIRLSQSRAFLPVRGNAHAGLAEVLAAVVGRSLPRPLRRYLWRLHLSDSGGERARRRHRELARAAGLKGIADPSRSPIAPMISEAVRHQLAALTPLPPYEYEASDDSTDAARRALVTAQRNFHRVQTHAEARERARARAKEPAPPLFSRF